MSDVFQKNINAGSARFPELFQKLLTINHQSIQNARTNDGGYCYVMPGADGRLTPLSNHINPIQMTQLALDKMKHRLTGGFAPAVVVGLNPGFLLETIFNHFKSRVSLGEPFRQIYVIIDSLECLAGWLKVTDRTEILLKPEVEFYWHKDVNKIAELCEKDEGRSHLFIPVSSLSEPLLEKIIDPLALLYLNRQKETALLKNENSKYYDQFDDKKLADVFAGRAARKPRLLMPTHSSSTVVQYSTRDICAAFVSMGWETKILKVNWDLSEWRMGKAIHDFKPDLLIFINHLRTEDSTESIYPENMMFVTWIQDTMLLLNNNSMARHWNEFSLGVNSKTGKQRRRDLLIGYTDIIKPFGYAKERMSYLPMIVDYNFFHPRKLTPAQIEKYGCDLCFASNKGKSTESVLEVELLPYLASFNISRDTAYEIHDFLWSIYREEKTITSYAELEKTLCSSVASFNAVFGGIGDKLVKDNIIQKLFWTLNDTIYRHIVLEWCDELGCQMNLYGKYWEDHPRFKKYARGVVVHGEELSVAYQAAKYCLHLNAIEGTHQRLDEILSVGNALRRVLKLDDEYEIPYDELFDNILECLTSGKTFSAREEAAVLQIIIRLLNQSSDKYADDFSVAAKEIYEELILYVENHRLPNVSKCNNFFDKKSLKAILENQRNFESSCKNISSHDGQNLVSRIRNNLLYFLNEEGPFVHPKICQLFMLAKKISKRPMESPVSELFSEASQFSPDVAMDILKECSDEDQCMKFGMLESVSYKALSGNRQKGIFLIESAKTGLPLSGTGGLEKILDEARHLYSQSSAVNSCFAEIAVKCFVPFRRWDSAMALLKEENESGRLKNSYVQYLCEAYMEIGDFAKAEAVLCEAYKKNKHLNEAFSYLAFRCLFKNMLKEAAHLLDLEAELRKPESAYYYATRCILELLSGSPDTSYSYIEKGVLKADFLLNCLFALHTWGIAGFDENRTKTLLALSRNSGKPGMDHFVSELKLNVILRNMEKIKESLDEISSSLPEEKLSALGFLNMQLFIDGGYSQDELKHYFKKMRDALTPDIGFSDSITVAFICLWHGEIELCENILNKASNKKRFLSNGYEVLRVGLLYSLSGESTKAEDFLNISSSRLGSFPFYSGLVDSTKDRSHKSTACKLPVFDIPWKDYNNGH